jgi:predicted transcriptional regulator
MSDRRKPKTEDPGLPTLENLAGWIRQTRKELGLTQTEVGEEAHLSPSQLSRLESAQGNPSYEAVYRVYDVLNSKLEEPDAGELLRWKRHRIGEELSFEYVTPDDTCEEVSRLMEKYEISQLPVVENGEAVGSITETDLMEAKGNLEEVSVGEVSGEPFPEVSEEAGVASIRSLLRAYPAVLIKATDKESEDAVVGRYAGILTRADLRNTG